MTKVVKRINEAIFIEIKQHITKHGIEAAAKKWPGYNRRTFMSISKQADYKTWREKRRAAQKATAKPQALKSVATPQSVAVEPKKPGHGRQVHRVVSRLEISDEVTREEFDRITDNLAAQLNTLGRRYDTLRSDVDSLLKEEAAYLGAEILIQDKAANSAGERVKRALKRASRRVKRGRR